jgi:hypoxanthine phosphoribosyltransferase
MLIPKHIQKIYKASTCLYTKEQIETALDRMAKEICLELEDTNPILLCVMIGGLVLTGNLLLRLDFPLTLNYIHATRYQGKLTGEALEWKAKPNLDLKNRTVLLLDDILDGGLTLAAAKKYCEAQGAVRINTAVLLDKLNARLPDGIKQADFTALSIEDGYVFGYGMDYEEYLRNAPGIFIAPTDIHSI